MSPPTLKPTTNPTIKPLVPKNLVTPSPITKNAVVTLSCPPEMARDCRFQMLLYAALGVIPKSTKKEMAKPRAVLLGRATATLKPGARRPIKLTLSAAGKRAVRAKARATARLVITVRADGGTRTATLRMKVGGK